MGMDLIQEDPQLYMSHDDMIALFNGADVNHFFSPDFNIPGGPGQHQQHASGSQQAQQPSSSAGDGQNSVNVVPPGAPGFTGPAYMEVNGLTTSP
jgi:hypothetical protein